ncbi:MAG TPA: protein kinase [Gemmatimonadales bacterium]|nr:protein kinase [Gemmatimonadales bacterium]
MIVGPGARIGPYEVTALIGEGGMGKVWRAHHALLKRDDALKVLPDAFADDADRLARFQREAQVLASLNHPNIAHVYGLETSDGTRALVMELVEGPTVADRIAHGAIPLEESLSIARQIADALGAAHERGIIHRDLKPANVKVRPDGAVKVLDFGLAKALDSGPASGAAVESPTITSPAMTRAGIILGTAAYMSPEQARGKPVDKRADIWSFGVVLYEMLTGRRPFQGEDVTETLAAVVMKEPELGRAPFQVRRLLSKCLEKDPKKRLHDIGDVWTLLDDDAARAPARFPKTAAALIGVLALALVVVSVLYWRAARDVEQPLERLPVDLGPDVSLGSGIGADVIISPDGTRLVWVSNSRLFTRRLDQTNAVELPDTAGAAAPFFKPDGRSVGFFAQGMLKAVSFESGEVKILCAAANGAGGSWGEDGFIIAALTQSRLSRIPEAGGTPELLMERQPQSGESLRWPHILPGGKAVLFTASSFNPFPSFDEGSIEVLSIESRQRKTLQRGGTYGRYIPASDGQGHLLYVAGGTLFAIRLDPERLELVGEPVPMLEEVAYGPNPNGTARFDVSRTGTLIYRTGPAGVPVTVQWVDSSGTLEPVLADPAVYARPTVSPDGRRLAVEMLEKQKSYIWVRNLRLGGMSKVTADGRSYVPLWSPDSRYIVFGSPDGTWWTPSDHASPQPLIKSGRAQMPWSFTRDGKQIAIQDWSGSSWDVTVATIESGRDGVKSVKTEPVVNSESAETHPTFSPDDRWLAYTSNDSGSPEVYVRAYPNAGRRFQISNAGGSYSRWGPAGSRTLFFEDDYRIMAATYTIKGDEFVVEQVRPWSETTLAQPFGNAKNYDLAPDGKRVIALIPARTQEHQVIFLRNFADELRRRVPVGR